MVSMYDLHCNRNECYFCGIKNPHKTTGKKFRSLIEVHHIKEQNEGGNHSKHNLVPCCGNCHSKVHLGLIEIDTWYNLHYCYRLKWVDEFGEKQFGPKSLS